MTSREFKLSEMSEEQLAERLSGKWPLVADPGRPFAGSYYDTFDWRLYQAGLSLFLEEDKGRPVQLTLKTLADGVVRWSGLKPQPPGMLVDVSDSKLRDLLAPVIEMRRLLPQVRIEGKHNTARLLNEDQKTVVRLGLVTGQGLAGGRDPVTLPLLVQINRLKGYNDDANKLESWLEHHQATLGKGSSYLQDVFTALHLKAGEYTSKLDFRLDPSQRADAAAKHILLYLLNVIEANEHGVLNDTDSEFLHDFRVAIRRTRSALTQIKDVFEPQVVERFKEDFAWLGQITGPTRDLDVYLLKFPEYLSSLPAGFSGALEPFHHYLEVHQRTEQAELAKEIRSARYRKIVTDWRRFLEEPVPNIAIPANAVRPVREVANRRIYKMYRLVWSEGRAINDNSPPEELHELRKSCKKLRYLMEFFQSIYPDSEIKGLIKSIKVLLENLGDFQDLEVQANKLKGMAEDLRQEGAETNTLLAMGMLIACMLRRQQQEHQLFSQRFAEFSDASNKALYQKLFKHPGGGAA